MNDKGFGQCFPQALESVPNNLARILALLLGCSFLPWNSDGTVISTFITGSRMRGDAFW